MSFTILGPLAAGEVQLPFYSFKVPAGFPSPVADHLEWHIVIDELLDIRALHSQCALKATPWKVPGYSMVTRQWWINRSLLSTLQLKASRCASVCASEAPTSSLFLRTQVKRQR